MTDIEGFGAEGEAGDAFMVFAEDCRIDPAVLAGHLDGEIERLKSLKGEGHELATKIEDIDGRTIPLIAEGFVLEQLGDEEEHAAETHRRLHLKEAFQDHKGVVITSTVVAVGAIFAAARAVHQRKRR